MKTRMHLTAVLFASLCGWIVFGADGSELPGGTTQPVVKNVRVQQRYPWNGKVDIEFLIDSADAERYFSVSAICYDNVGKTNIAMRTVRYNDSEDASSTFILGNGCHKLTWDGDADCSGQFFENISISLIAEGPKTYLDRELDTAMPIYVIIDVSGGANVEKYPVTTMKEMPSGGWGDEYKKTKIVLRRLWRGKDPLNRYTLTKDFYLGVFEITQKQWEMVMGTNPSARKGDMRPVEKVNYEMIRGSNLGSQWPKNAEVDATSFIGKLRDKTGLDTLDLPTEAQWEYACRAGTTSSYNNGGNSLTDLHQLGRYTGNKSDGKGGYSDAHTKVGSYLPNAWGLYDMHGNVSEWCLDWTVNELTGDDPPGAASGYYRHFRGGYFLSNAEFCTSSRRNESFPSTKDYALGFRLFRICY